MTKEQTITLKTTASKSRLQANTLWVNHTITRRLLVDEESEIQDVLSIAVLGNDHDPQPVMMMTRETAAHLYKELGEVLDNDSDEDSPRPKPNRTKGIREL